MRFLEILIFTFLTSFALAQVKIPANTKADVQLILVNTKSNNGIPTKEIMDRFAINSINNEYYVSFLASST